LLRADQLTEESIMTHKRIALVTGANQGVGLQVAREPEKSPDGLRGFRIAGLDGLGEGWERGQLIVLEWSRIDRMTRRPVAKA
jgi:hypothetical protein